MSPGALADYQLGGGYPPAPYVTVVARDSTDTPAPWLFNICCVNGFRTQPGADWPEALLLHGSDSSPLANPGWSDEFWSSTIWTASAARAGSWTRVTRWPLQRFR